MPLEDIDVRHTTGRSRPSLYRLYNLTGDTIHWSTANRQNWLEPSPSEGVLDTGEFIEVLLRVLEANLPVEISTDLITFTDETHQKTQQWNVTLRM
jgi:hypothetical protein